MRSCLPRIFKAQLQCRVSSQSSASSQLSHAIVAECCCPTRLSRGGPKSMPWSKLRSRPKHAPLSIEEILRWAGASFATHGTCPNITGDIPDTLDDTWRRIDDSLCGGHRGLPNESGLSLARLWELHRRARNSEYPPQLSVPQLFKWAKAFHQRVGEWTKEGSGPIPKAVAETW